jgi:micrococcal nuclease
VAKPATMAFAYVRSPVTRGSTGEVTVRTTPGAICSITVTYSSGPSTEQGLTIRTADGSGIVTWSWTVSTQASPGTWPIQVECDGASAHAMFRVQ